MESFFRYISYVDYYKKGEKVKNVGFLRWKLHNDKHYIEIQLKGIEESQGNFEIKEKNTGKAIGKIIIDKGIGSFTKEFSSMSTSSEMYIDTFDDRLYLSDVEGFLIRLDENEYLTVSISLGQEKKQDRFDLISETNIGDNLSAILEEDKQIIMEKKDVEAASENVLIEGIEEKYIDSTSNKKMKIIEPIHEDKWQQLCSKYPHIHPFPDRKIFLSIKPEDFIILQQGYQKLVNNSFLLHGFYNYGHMILGKLSEDEKAPIYIGVPGVYYEREKQAAQMFGFVGFESTEHLVQAGSYGYYMIEVEI